MTIKLPLSIIAENNYFLSSHFSDKFYIQGHFIYGNVVFRNYYVSIAQNICKSLFVKMYLENI